MPAAPLEERSAWWRSQAFATLVLLGILLALHAAMDVFAGLERRLYDAASSTRAPASSDHVALIGIDARSLAHLGQWPWPRDLLAQMVDQLTAAKAATVVLALPLAEPQVERGLSHLRRIQELLPPAVAADPGLAQRLAEAERGLDGDGLLAASLGAAGNVLLPAWPAPRGVAVPTPAPAAARYLRRSLVGKTERLVLPAAAIQLPAPQLAEAAAGIGHLVPTPDPDGVQRAVALLAGDQFGTMASLPLMAAVRARGLTVRDIRVVPPAGVQAGDLLWPADGAGRVRVAWHRAPLPVAQDSFVDVLGGTVAAARFTGKLVVVGLTAEGLAAPVDTPAGPMALPLWVARTAAGLLDGALVRQPHWGPAVQWAATALVAVFLVVVRPRLSAGAAVAAGAALAGALLTLDAGLLVGLGLWVPLAAPTAMLLLVPVLLGLGARLRDRVAAAHAAGGSSGAAATAGHPPAMLGRYALEGELGRGAMGVVYRGRDPRIGRLVAIKTLALGEEFEAEAVEVARQRFFREAETAGRLQHPCIVTIFDVGEERELAYIAMEYLQGQDLLVHGREDRLLPIEQVVSIGARVAEGLDYAHRQNVVHRDIKPANIMYASETDTVKVTDFGIARITDSTRTRTGVALGTPSFMSPEHLAGRQVDGRSDLYSLGVTLYQLLTGVLPFRAESLAELMYRITNEPPCDPRQHRPELPAALAELIVQALAKQPDARFQRGRDMAAALRASLLCAGPAEAPAPPPIVAPQSVKSASAVPLPDYDATQELSPDLLEAYAKTIAIHRPPAPSHAAETTDLRRQSPDRR